MQKENKPNIILFLNIAFIFAIVFATFLFQKNYFLFRHDYFLTESNIDFFFYCGRIPAGILHIFISHIIPNFLNLNVQDYCSGYRAIINAVLVGLIITTSALGFNAYSTKPILKALLKPLFFIFALFAICSYAFPLELVDIPHSYLGFICEVPYFIENSFGLTFYFIFFITLIRFIVNEDKGNFFLYLFALLNTVIVCLYNESFNTSILLFIFVLFIINPKIFKNKKVLFLQILPAIITTVIFFLSSSWMEGKGASHETNLIKELTNITGLTLVNFGILFFKNLIWNKIIYFLLMIFMIFKLFQTKNENNIKISQICISLLIGFLLSNFLYLLVKDVANSYGCTFLFERDINKFVYAQIITFSFIVIAGCFFSNFKIYINLFIALVCVLFGYSESIYYPNLTSYQKEKLETKINVYEMEKINLIYNQLGESTIFPASYLEKNSFRYGEIFTFFDQFKYDQKENYETFMKDKYFDPFYSLYDIYFENTYKKPFIGFQFKDDEIAQIELNKRASLLNEKIETKEELQKNQFKFKTLDKYKNKYLTIEDVEKLSFNTETEYLKPKIKGYIYFRNNDFDNAIKEYNEYLKNNPNDFDALYFLSEIYYQQENYNKAKELLQKLHNLDENNITFLHKLLVLTFKEKNYVDALNICKKMHEVENKLFSVKMNEAVILILLGKKEEAEKIITYLKVERNKTINEFLAINNLNSIDEINENRKIDLLHLNFY